MTLPAHSLGMSPAAEHLRARIAEVLKQGPGVRRYGAELKHAVVEYAFVRKDEGATIREIAEELGLSAGLLYKWLHYARLESEDGTGPFEPGEPLPVLDPQRLTAEPSAEEEKPAEAVPFDTVRGSAPGRGETRRQAAAFRPIVIPATTLAEFLAGALASHGSIRRAAEGIGILTAPCAAGCRAAVAMRVTTGMPSSMP